MAIEKRVGKTGTAYRVRVDLLPDPATGERRFRRGTFGTKKEAERAEREWESEKDRGIYIDPPKLTVAELFAQWLEVWKGTNPKPRTVLEYRRIIDTRQRHTTRAASAPAHRHRVSPDN